jgi:hypothetical protein
MPKHDIKTLAGRLAYAMELRGFGGRGGQTALAKRTGIKQPSIHDILKGNTRELQARTLIKLADALQIHGRWLADGRPPIDKLSHVKPLTAGQEEEAENLLDGYYNAPEATREIVYNDLLAKYMTKNQKKDTGERGSE